MHSILKYGIVGVGNTLLTLGVIFVCKALLGVNPYVANALGYAAGVANAFVWNRHWVFSGGRDRRLTGQAVLFLCGVGVCYFLQLALVWGLTVHGPMAAVEWRAALPGGGEYVLGGYGMATLAGNVFYTLASYTFNRLVAFRTFRKPGQC